ncbi:MAG: hypothetical protein Q4D62_09950 [Planctomycetia bacterium]|nr:hypothetical protein [Planctomycetia bacterium]
MREKEPENYVQWGDVLRALVSQFVPGRGPLATAAVIILLFFVGMVVIWRSVAHDQLQKDAYILTPDKIELIWKTADGEKPAPPPWVCRDVVLELLQIIERQYNHPQNEPFSILDTRIITWFHDALRQHPWIRRTVEIRKMYPARLRLVVEFRRPVLMVEVTQPDDEMSTFFPVDEDGKLLPTCDFPLSTLDLYPHLKEYPFMPLGMTPGSCWTEKTVADAVAIVKDFGPLWNQLGLHSLQAVRREEEGFRHEIQYDIYTHHGSVIHWGRPGQFSNTAKIRQLVERQNQLGTLDSPESPRVFSFRTSAPP